MQQVSTQGYPVASQAVPSVTPQHPRLAVTLFLYSPVSSVAGSPGLWYSQPLTASTIPFAGLWVILLDLIIQIIAWMSRRGVFSSPCNPGLAGAPGTISMTLGDLTEFLAQLKRGSVSLPVSPSTEVTAASDANQPRPGWFTVYLLVSGWTLPGVGIPNFSLFVPLFELQGLTGGLPILILSLIATILVRAAVPPTTSGVQPIGDDPPEPSVQLKWQELLQMLRSYGKYFR